jgi:hypothetical protein
MTEAKLAERLAACQNNFHLNLRAPNWLKLSSAAGLASRRNVVAGK